MKLIRKSEHGKELVFLRKGEDYPGTKHITGKQGYYIVTPDPVQPFRQIVYLGARMPHSDYFMGRF